MAGRSALCALVLLATAIWSRATEVSERPDALSTLRGELLGLERSLWEKILDPRWHEVTDANAQGPDIAVARAFHKFSKKINSKEWAQQTDNVVQEWWVWSKLTEEMRSVNKLYNAFDIFMRYQANQKVASPSEKWIKLAEDTAQNATVALDRIFYFIMHGNVYLQIIKESQMHMCDLKQSQSQLLYNMYNTILLTEIKGYSVIQFSWMILRLYGKGNFTEEANMATDRYNERTAMTMAAVKDALSTADRVLWRCNPNHHVEGETYLQLTRFLQGYIENEVDMNQDGSCKENCAYYSIGQSRGCFKDQFCSRQPSCKGKILNCRYIDSDMQICLAPQSKNITRRYDYITYENGKQLGRKTNCARGSTKVFSWWRWLFWHCSYCFCVCEHVDLRTDRHFSLKNILADSKMNKVITGIRFTKVNRVIHLQISEGTLLPGALIESKSVQWRQVDPIDIRKSIKGVDYHEMTNEERAVDLDDLEGPLGHVMTGIRFRKIGAHLNFEIQTMPFDFKTGKLIQNKAVWISNDNTGASAQPRTKVSMQSPDIPTRVIGPSVILSKSDQYIEFDHSDFDFDAGQTTVPFIDAQPVISSIPTPLTGAGIYHKGMAHSGGYIAPKIFTYDFTDHILESLDEATDDKDSVEFTNHVPLV